MDHTEKTQTEQLTDLLLKPARTGVYLSKHDIVAIALALDSAVTVGERKMMFKDLFKLIDTQERLIQMVDAIRHVIEMKIDEYDALITIYPACEHLFDERKERANETLTHLEQIKEELSL